MNELFSNEVMSRSMPPDLVSGEWSPENADWLATQIRRAKQHDGYKRAREVRREEQAELQRLSQMVTTLSAQLSEVSANTSVVDDLTQQKNVEQITATKEGDV